MYTIDGLKIPRFYYVLFSDNSGISQMFSLSERLLNRDNMEKEFSGLFFDIKNNNGFSGRFNGLINKDNVYFEKIYGGFEYLGKFIYQGNFINNHYEGNYNSVKKLCKGEFFLEEDSKLLEFAFNKLLEKSNSDQFSLELLN
jgi:hypothetical protein